MKHISILTLGAVQLAQLATASFYVHIGNDIRLSMDNRFWFYRSQLSRDAVVIMNSYAEKSDVRGNAQGVVCEGNLCKSRWICEGTSCRPNIPEDIDRFEINTGFGHYSPYPNVPFAGATWTLFHRLISAFSL